MHRVVNGELRPLAVADGRELLRVPTAERLDSLAGAEARPDEAAVELVAADGSLRRYPITRAQVLAAACRVLARSELAETSKRHCE